MRYVLSFLGLLSVVLSTGCPEGRKNIFRPEQKAQIPPDVPTTVQLVKYMDDNAQRIKSLRCDDVDLSVTAPGQMMPVQLMGRMACQQNRRFRMSASALGKQEVDLGSNEQEFWYWIPRGDPVQRYCSYQALSEGKVRELPFPFQPDWVMETLGMGNYGPADRYQILVEPEKFKLIEKVRGPQGNPLRKVIVFQRRPASGRAPVITDYQLVDDTTGQEICSAHVYEIQGDANTGWVPRRIELRWPEQQLKMGMQFRSVKLNPQLNDGMFVRAAMPGVTSSNLATGQVDPQLNSLRPAGGQ